MGNAVAWFEIFAGRAGQPTSQRGEEPWTKHMIDAGLDPNHCVADLTAMAIRIAGNRYREQPQWSVTASGRSPATLAPPRDRRHNVRPPMSVNADGDGDRTSSWPGAATDASAVAWYENNGKPALKWQRHTIAESLPTASEGGRGPDADGTLEVAVTAGAPRAVVSVQWRNPRGSS
jgi:hypothetical protein